MSQTIAAVRHPFLRAFVRSYWRPTYQDGSLKTDLGTIAAGIERGRSLPCVRAARVSQRLFSHMNPVVKNRIVQICPPVRSTCSLVPVNKIAVRRSSEESPNRLAGPFMHFTANTKFRSQRNMKKHVPTIPISSKNSSKAL